jgi:hypothetical protein
MKKYMERISGNVPWEGALDIPPILADPAECGDAIEDRQKQYDMVVLAIKEREIRMKNSLVKFATDPREFIEASDGGTPR